MKVAILQQNAQDVLSYTDVRKNLISIIEKAGKDGADLLVMPECAYPAYFLGIDMVKADEAVSKSQQFADEVGKLAAKYSMYIALGIAIKDNGVMYNAGLFFDKSGKIINRAYKSNMWHIDSKWFGCGSSFEVFDTDFGKMGLIVCADGRVPEISRILALKGAKVIIDVVNLVASASDPKQLMNQQYEFILPARAYENKAWYFVSNKSGMESKSVVYLGRSMIIDPDGQIIADCPPEGQQVLYYDVDLLKEYGKILPRRPELYKELVVPFKNTQAYKKSQSLTGIVADYEAYVCPVQYSAETFDDYVKDAGYFIDKCQLLDADLIFLPQPMCDIAISDVVKSTMSHISSDTIVVASAYENGIKCACAFNKEKVLSYWYKSHGDNMKEKTSFEVFETSFGSIGVMFDDEGLIPEVARVYMLKGCDLLLWSDSSARAMDQKIMQTRAAENKMFVARNSTAPNTSGAIANPDGRILASTFKGCQQATGAEIFTLSSRAKTVVPGTHIVEGRLDVAYKYLTE